MLALSLHCLNCIEDFQLCSICRDIPCCYPLGNSEEGLKIATRSISGWRFDSRTENSHSLQHGKRAAGAPVSPWEMGLTPTWHLNSLYEAVIKEKGHPGNSAPKVPSWNWKWLQLPAAITPQCWDTAWLHVAGRKGWLLSLFSAWSFSLLLEPIIICSHKI